MTPSDKCYSLIKRFEGLRLKAYPDPATGGEPWTVGIGHCGPEVHQGLVIDERIADAYLVKDTVHAADAVNSLVRVDLTQNQFDALVSFVFNCGAGAFSKSTMLRKLNEGDYVVHLDHGIGRTRQPGRRQPRKPAPRMSVVLAALHHPGQ